MIKLPNLVGFEGLLDLDRQGVDIRPTLLRVLTDQYLQTPTHTPDEERHYTELALRLLDETDIATRAAVAVRLAPHACTPLPIVQQLGRDVLEVAEPILRYSPRLTPADLNAIIADRGSCYADIIAKRGKPDPVPVAAAKQRPVQAAAARQERPEAARHTPAIAVLPPRREPEPIQQLPASAPPPARDDAPELCELFFAAGATERQLILMTLDYVPEAPQEPPAAMKRTDIWRLESAALQHNTEAVVRDLERALSISRTQARRIVNDELGDPIVVAAKAMELPADVLQRMLLFMNPRVGQSVDRVYELAALYHEISVDAARRLISIWRNADPPDTPAARHEASWQDATDNARQALSEVTRRTPANRAPERPVHVPEKRVFRK